MYSMVLMVAMTGGAEAPDWGRHGCWGGCYGGGWGGWAGCYGGGYYGRGGYYGYSGWGGGCWGGGGGCWGGGYGCYGSGYGCWGGGYGCYGSPYASWSCYGGYALGGYPYGGGWGMANATPVMVTAPSGVVQAGYYNPGNAPVAAAGQPAAGTPGSNRAALVVRLPADAKLTVDNTPTQATSDTRRFVTPALEPGATYRYTLRAEVNRNGVTEKTSRDVNVRAGETTNVSLDFPGQRASK